MKPKPVSTKKIWNRRCLANLFAGTEKMVETRAMTEAHTTQQSGWMGACVPVCVEECACVCVCEREREREREPGA